MPCPAGLRRPRAITQQLEVWLLQAHGCPVSGELLWGQRMGAAWPRAGTPAPRPAVHRQCLTRGTEAQPQPQGGTTSWCSSSHSTPHGQAGTVPCSPHSLLLRTPPEVLSQALFLGDLPQQQASKPRPPWEGFPGGAHLHRGVTAPTTEPVPRAGRMSGSGTLTWKMGKLRLRKFD